MGRTIGPACTRSVAPPAAAPGAAQLPPLPQGVGVPPEATTLVKVRDNVYAIVNAKNAVIPDILLYGGNVAVYLTAEGVVLVDSKNERMHDDLVAKVRSLTGAPIAYVVLTHNHADHSAGAAGLRALGATVITSAADRRRMAAAGDSVLPQIGYEGLAELDFDFMIPGHGPVLTKQQFLAHRDKMAALRARAKQLVRAHKSEQEIAQVLAAEFHWGGPGPAAGNVAGMIEEFR